jgi:hypothetical protein
MSSELIIIFLGFFKEIMKLSFLFSITMPSGYLLPKYKNKRLLLSVLFGKYIHGLSALHIPSARPSSPYSLAHAPYWAPFPSAASSPPPLPPPSIPPLLLRSSEPGRGFPELNILIVLNYRTDTLKAKLTT